MFKRKIMLSFIGLFIWGNSFANDLEKDFEKLVSLYGEEYVKLKNNILKKDNIEDFLIEKSKLKEITLEKIQALILLEYLNSKDKIKAVLSCQILNYAPTTGKNGGVFRSIMHPGRSYPHSISDDKLKPLMQVYQETPCPYFILECNWKFYNGLYELAFVTKNMTEIKKYTHHNFRYILSKIIKELSEDKRTMYILSIKDKLRYLKVLTLLKYNTKNYTKRFEISGVPREYIIGLSQLISLNTKDILPIFKEFVNSYEIENIDMREILITLLLPMISNYANLSEIEEYTNNELLSIRKYCEKIKYFKRNSIVDNISIKSYMKEFFDSIRNQTKLSKGWINKYICTIKCWSFYNYLDKDFIKDLEEQLND